MSASDILKAAGLDAPAAVESYCTARSMERMPGQLVEAADAALAALAHEVVKLSSQLADCAKTCGGLEYRLDALEGDQGKWTYWRNYALKAKLACSTRH